MLPQGPGLPFWQTPYRNGVVAAPVRRPPSAAPVFYQTEQQMNTAGGDGPGPLGRGFGSRRSRSRAPYFRACPAAMPSLLMIPLLTAAGLAGFWLFYKSVDFFDHI